MPSQVVVLLKRAYCEWSSHNAMRLAAAMAFYSMMSLAPMLVVALTVLSLFFTNDVQGKIQGRADMLLGQQGGQIIAQMLTSIAQLGSRSLIPTLISFIVALVSGSSLFLCLQEALDTIWDVRPRPGAGWRAMVWPRLVAVVVLFAASAVLLASLIISTVLTVVVHHLPGRFSWSSVVGEIVISFVVIALMFALAYKFLPSMKIEWNDVWLGAALAALLFLVGKWGLTFYFRFASVKPFGAAGSLAALLIWVYYSAAIIFFGAAFTRAYAERDGRRVEPDRFGSKFMMNDRSNCGEA